MANVPISSLPAATVPLSGAELMAVVQGGVTSQAPASALRATATGMAQFATYAAMTSAVSVSAGDVCFTATYDNVLNLDDGAAGNWLVAAAGARTANGGTILDHDTLPLQFHRLLGGVTPNVKMWGAPANGIGDDAPATTAAINTVLGWDIATAATKSTTFNAVAGNLYPCDLTAAPFTTTLNANPTQGDRVGFKDSATEFATNNLTINGNGKPIAGSLSDKVLSTNGQWYVLEYDATNGWCVASTGGALNLASNNRWDSEVLIDESIRTSVQETRTLTLQGSGPGSCHVLVAHSGVGLRYQGNSGGWGSYVQLRDFSLFGPGSTTVGSVGVWIDNAPWFDIERVHVWNFERGWDTTDVLSGMWHHPLIRFCKWGFRARFSDLSRPNSLVLDHANFGNCSHYAGYVSGGAGFELRGGQNEGNGQSGGVSTSGGGSWFFYDCGVEGKTGVTIAAACYTEGTGGDQDFYFEQTTGSAVHTLMGCSLARISSSYYTINNIRLSVSPGAYMRVNAVSCAFGALSTYVESASRPYIGGTTTSFRATMCTFESAVATTVMNNELINTYTRKRGLILSNGASDPTNDITISAGGWMDDTFTYAVVIASALTKRLDAAWAVGDGNGGLDTGSIADTSYHLWAIKRSDTGVCDALFSASPTAPTMPSNYDLKVYIGSIVRASAAIRLFKQEGNIVTLKVPGLGFTAYNGDMATAAVSRALAGIPTGISCVAIVTTKLTDLSPATDVYMRVMSLYETDAAAGSTNATHQTTVTYDGLIDCVDFQTFRVQTDTAAQIAFRTSLYNADIYASGIVRGWEYQFGVAA